MKLASEANSQYQDTHNQHKDKEHFPSYDQSSIIDSQLNTVKIEVEPETPQPVTAKIVEDTN